MSAPSSLSPTVRQLCSLPTTVVAEKYILTTEEAEDAVSVMLSPQAARNGLRFPCTTAGLRKLVNIKNGVWDMNGNVGQCIDMPMFYYDWYHNKVNSHELIEYGKILGREEWKRCENTGLWFVGEKPFKTCLIETCRACEPFFRVYEGQNKLVVKFYFWDEKCRPFQSYLRFFQRFYLLFEKDRNRNPDMPHEFRHARMMMVKRQALGDFNFRYSFSENFIKDYVTNHLKFSKMEQLVDFPIELQVQLFNTVLNDTIVMATEEEVKRWVVT